MKTTLYFVITSLVFSGAAKGDSNLIRNGRFDLPANREWIPAQHVSIERKQSDESTDATTLKVSWQDVTAFTDWAKSGNLLRTAPRILNRPLQRDTRYRLSCRIKVERLQLAPEAEAWYTKLPKGQFDPPTVTVGCQGGHWNSGMPCMAYDMTKKGTWQELHCEFVTPLNGAGGFVMTFDAYPYYLTPMRCSGTLYLDDVRLELCAPRVGFTRSRQQKTIDGDLSDWWQTNPVVITADQVSCGNETANRDASGLFYTMWDDSYLYVAAKVIDDDVTDADGVAVLLEGCEYFVSTVTQPAIGKAVFRRLVKLGATANMYRIVSQHGEEVRRCDGYVVELAIPLVEFKDGNGPSQVAFEIHDSDHNKETRRLRYPYVAGSVEQRVFANANWANRKGELRGGERPIYAITDAANDRDKPRTLAVKNVTYHVVTQGRLGYPLALYRRGDPKTVDAVVSWTTNLPSSGRLEFGRNESYGQSVAAFNAVGEPTSNVMRVILRGLDRGRRYRFRIIARPADGTADTISDDFVLATTDSHLTELDYGEVALTVRNGARVPRHAWPVTSGIPLPEGHLFSANHLRLVNASNETVDAQFTPLAEWPDGSLKWVLVDFQSDVSASSTRSYVLAYGSTVTPEPSKTSLQVREETTRIVIDTGTAQFVVNKQQFNLFDEVWIGDRIVAGGGRLVMTDSEGRQFVARKPDIVEIEEAGPLRVCLRVAGKYLAEDATALFDYEVRIHAYVGSSRVRINHNYTSRLRHRIDPSVGRMRPTNPVPIAIKSMWLELPLRGGLVSSVRCGTVADDSITVPLAPDGVVLRQQYESQASIANHQFTRLPGWVSVGGVTIGVRQFWQLYPKAIAIRPTSGGSVVRIDTLPAIDRSDYPSKPKTPEDFVWGYLKDGKYRLRRGEGRSHDIFINFATKATEISSEATAMVAEPLFAAAQPQWYCNSGAIGAVRPRSQRFESYDRSFTKALDGISKSREREPFFQRRFGRYGLRNFGDNFGSDGMNWDNVEYDMGHCCLLQFMRTGNLRALRLGREILSHNMDVDCVHIRDGFEYLCHHTDDHNAKLAGVGHTWCEGIWEYYYLTGDRHAARKAIGIGNRLAREAIALCASGYPGAGGSRNFGWSVIGLMATFQATADPLYLNAAREIEEVAVRTQHPFRGGWVHRLSIGHCYHAPAHMGRVHFMQDIVLNGQVAFHQLTDDPDVKQCLQNAVDGMLGEFATQKDQGLPGWGYTSCPFMLEPGPIQHATRVDNRHSFGALASYMAVYYVGSLANNSHLNTLRSIYALPPPSGCPVSGNLPTQSKGFAQSTRWFPNLMYYIDRMPKLSSTRRDKLDQKIPSTGLAPVDGSTGQIP